MADVPWYKGRIIKIGPGVWQDPDAEPWVDVSASIGPYTGPTGAGLGALYKSMEKAATNAVKRSEKKKVDAKRNLPGEPVQRVDAWGYPEEAGITSVIPRDITPPSKNEFVIAEQPEFKPGMNIAEQGPGGIAAMTMEEPPGPAMTRRGNRVTAAMTRPAVRDPRVQPELGPVVPPELASGIGALVDEYWTKPMDDARARRHPANPQEAADYATGRKPGQWQGLPSILPPGEADARRGMPSPTLPDAPNNPAIQEAATAANPPGGFEQVQPDQPVPVAPPQTETTISPAVQQESGRAMIEKALADIGYSANPANPAQDKADANAERQLQRDAMLAQLALAAGVTASGGKGWKDIAAGFQSAGQVYDAGFDRYQKALQSSADRYAERAGNEMALKQKIALGGLEIDQARAKAATDAEREAAKERRKFFVDQITANQKARLDALPKLDGDIAPTPEELAERQRMVEEILRQTEAEYRMGETIRRGSRIPPPGA